MNARQAFLAGIITGDWAAAAIRTRAAAHEAYLASLRDNGQGPLSQAFWQANTLARMAFQRSVGEPMR